MCWILWVLCSVAQISAFQDLALKTRAQVLLQESQSFLEKGETRQALKLIHEARALQVKLGQQYRILAQQQRIYGNLTEAQNAIEKAIEYNNQDDIAHLDLGYFFLLKKDYAKAIKQLRRSLQLNPDNPLATDLLAQATRQHYLGNGTKSFKHYTIPSQAIVFHEADSLRIELSYALPKVGLTRAGGVGVVHINEHIEIATMQKPITYLTQLSRLPEYGKSFIAQNYLLRSHTFRVPHRSASINILIKDTKIGSNGRYQAPIHSPVEPYLFGISTPLLAHSISSKNETPENRTDLNIVPNPLRLYQTDSPLYVYIELYNLLPNSLGTTDFELSYQITWPNENEITLQLFEALDSDLYMVPQQELAELHYLIPSEHRMRYGVDSKATLNQDTRVTIPYMSKRSNDFTYLEIDISHLPVGVHKLILQGRDLMAEEIVTRTALFRIVPKKSDVQ